jgi:cold-inducible RNA-binding protein
VANNLYVGNMAFSTTEETLRELFSQYGTVTKAQLVMDRETGRPRGFAFIEMSDGGDQAIAALNGSQLDGRSLTVNEAKPREERPRSGGGGGYGGGGGGGGGGGRRY